MGLIMVSKNSFFIVSCRQGQSIIFVLPQVKVPTTPVCPNPLWSEASVNKQVCSGCIRRHTISVNYSVKVVNPVLLFVFLYSQAQLIKGIGL